MSWDPRVLVLHMGVGQGSGHTHSHRFSHLYLEAAVAMLNQVQKYQVIP